MLHCKNGPFGVEKLLIEYRKRCEARGYPKAAPILTNPNDEICQRTVIASDSNDGVKGEITYYNPTGMIERNGKQHLALRVEPKACELDSHVIFFEKKEKMWEALEESPHLHLQDPFWVENVQGYHILGGVEVYTRKNSRALGYRTVFYRFERHLQEMAKPFAYGPKGMKDIRLIELANGKIAVFTRPQGGKNGPGRIGYIEIKKLEELTPRKINEAKIIENQFLAQEWGGVNDLHFLANGKIGVVGHIAHYEGRLKNYYAMSFEFDPASGEAASMKIIADAHDIDFPVDRKFDNLGHVIFSGGMRLEGKRAKLYAGVNDIHAVCFDLANPFLSAN